MELKDIQVIKSDERGTIYDCGPSRFIVRRKGTVSADHVHDDEEVIYLVEGKVALTIGEEVEEVQAPVMFRMASGQYHKLEALTDIRLVIEREGE